MNFFHKDKPHPSTVYNPTDDDLSNKQLAISMWILRYKQRVFDFGIFLLALWCVVSVSYSTYKWMEYAILGYWQDKRLLNESINLVQPYEDMQTSYTAQPLQISTPEVLTSADNTYDIFALITNPNTKHIAYVTYTFIFSNTTTPEKTIAILPGKKQFATELGYPTTIYPYNPTLRIISTRWQRISPHIIFDVSAYTDEHLNIETRDVLHTPAGTTSGSSDSISFTLHNKSAYSFYQINGYLVVRSNGTIIAIRPLSIERFLSDEQRTFDLRFLSPLEDVENIEFFPLINIFDPQAYISPGN
jgi:hypothetical protein